MILNTMYNFLPFTIYRCHLRLILARLQRINSSTQSAMDKLLFALCALSFATIIGCGSSSSGAATSGKLVIIGGGDKSEKILRDMLHTAGLQDSGYIAVLPMASAQPDSSYLDFAAEMKSVTPVPCINFNFSNTAIQRQQKLDSLKKAALIYICGGDQSRFMSGVLEQDVHNALREAFRNGATIAGTSAGAAVMSKIMITGDQQRDSIYHSTYEILESSNAKYATGLGFLGNTIIDQHFIKRSRYNRMLTALADHPGRMVVGIDESTAIVVQGDSARVVGESQVIVAEPVNKAMSENLKYSMPDVRLRVIIPGKSFHILR
jgi:cyanophycinase